MIVEVNNSNIEVAGMIHSVSWKESHRAFCSADFIEKHDEKAQAAYLKREIEAGKQVFLLIDKIPVGIVSISGNLIENLYILPTEQHKGYGTKLLHFAMKHCSFTPALWLLSNNQNAYRLYSQNGFIKTGKKNQLNDQLYEFEMRLGKKGFA